MNNLPIGVFDSGIGGLTVLKELIKQFSNESFIYLGDTARVPYGTRDSETIKRFSVELVDFLLKQKVKALVVACNTMSSVALSEIRSRSTVPVIDVISPTVEFVAENARNKKIGVIGTRATINSRAYEKAFLRLGIKIEARACPLFVPLVEERMLDGKATKIIAKNYLQNLKVDSLILGCTHYPLLSKVIQKAVGQKVTLIDSAYPTAKVLNDLLNAQNLLFSGNKPIHKLFVTDDTKKTEEVVKLFLGDKLPAKLQKVTV